MAVTAASIKAFAPGFAYVADTIIEAWIAFGASPVDSNVFGTAHDQALTLWVLHHLQTTAGGTDGGAIGAVIADRAGDVNTGYAAADKLLDASGLKTTAWGLAFMRLARLYAASPVII